MAEPEESRRRTTSFVDPALAESMDKSEDYENPLAGAMHGMAVSADETTTITAISGGPSPRETKVTYSEPVVVGKGSFGVVFKTRLVENGQKGRAVALKKVLQDRRYKNRELEILQSLDHCNVVEMLFYYFSDGQRGDKYLNVFMEFLPATLSSFADGYFKRKLMIPLSYIKLSTYQMFRALAYLHGRGICHRDIKPQNLLLNVATGVLKLCDFGCAKHLVSSQPNVSYICSRYYRAPELCLGASMYTHAIDVWSGGCVLGELLIGKPIFQGSTTADQLEKIMKVLGTPSPALVTAMNPKAKLDSKRQYPYSLDKLLKGRTAEEKELLKDLMAGLFNYDPKKRLNCLESIAHSFYDELRVPGTSLPNGQPLPPLFNFSPEELSLKPSLQEQLMPKA